MSYDQGLAERIRQQLCDQDVAEKKMFGGLCFMVERHMCCGILEDRLMARVGPAAFEVCLARPHVTEMDFTGRPSKGLIYVEPAGLAEDAELADWLQICLHFVRSLPPR